MRTTAEDGTPIRLVIQRLMDADLLLPEEGRALLEEIEAFAQARDEADGERASGISAPLLRMLEALLQTGRQDASVAGQARAIAHQILQRERNPAGGDPERTPRD